MPPIVIVNGLRSSRNLTQALMTSTVSCTCRDSKPLICFCRLIYNISQESHKHLSVPLWIISFSMFNVNGSDSCWLSLDADSWLLLEKKLMYAHTHTPIRTRSTNMSRLSMSNIRKASVVERRWSREGGRDWERRFGITLPWRCVVDRLYCVLDLTTLHWSFRSRWVPLSFVECVTAGTAVFPILVPCLARQR